MGIDVETVERLMGMYWKTERIKHAELRQIAAEIHKLAQDSSSLVQLAGEIGQLQVLRLGQPLDAPACEDIATRVFASAYA